MDDMSSGEGKLGFPGIGLDLAWRWCFGDVG